MTPDGAITVAKESIFLLIEISLPILLVALIVGLAISLLQALTQIQEMTLSFVPKILAIFLALLIFLPYIGEKLSAFSQMLAEMIVTGVG